MAVKEVVGLVSRVVEPNGLRRGQVAAKRRRSLLYCLVRQHLDGNYNDRPTAEIWSRKWVSLSKFNELADTHTHAHTNKKRVCDLAMLFCLWFFCIGWERERERAGDIERGWAVRVLKYAGIFKPPVVLCDVTVKLWRTQTHSCLFHGFFTVCDVHVLSSNGAGVQHIYSTNIDHKSFVLAFSFSFSFFLSKGIIVKVGGVHFVSS